MVLHHKTISLKGTLNTRWKGATHLGLGCGAGECSAAMRPNVPLKAAVAPIMMRQEGKGIRYRDQPY